MAFSITILNFIERCSVKLGMYIPIKASYMQAKEYKA